MAAKGSIAKNEIFEKLLEVFSSSFMYNDGKELRINMMENGEPVQIKVTLTAAKVPVESEEINFSEPVITNSSTINSNDPPPFDVDIQEPTAEEKERLSTLLEELGF